MRKLKCKNGINNGRNPKWLSEGKWRSELILGEAGLSWKSDSGGMSLSLPCMTIFPWGKRCSQSGMRLPIFFASGQRSARWFLIRWKVQAIFPAMRCASWRFLCHRSRRTAQCGHLFRCVRKTREEKQEWNSEHDVSRRLWWRKSYGFSRKINRPVQKLMFPNRFSFYASRCFHLLIKVLANL